MSTLTQQEAEAHSFETCWTLLERVADSAQLRRATRLRELLLYIGRRALKDGCRVREQEIGSAVFGRPDTYDTNVDNIVRASVSDLRKRIKAYFDSEGVNEPLIMEIPRGSYIPVFRAVVPASEAPQIPLPAPSAFDRRWVIVGSIILALAIGYYAGYWIEHRATYRLLYPWQYQPSVAVFWSNFLGANQEADVILGDTSFLLIQNIEGQTYSFNDYLNRNYIPQPHAKILSSDIQSILSLIAGKSLGNSSEFRLAEHILALDPQNKAIHLYNSREYAPALVAQDNVIFIGGRISNPWDQLFEGQLNFTELPDSNHRSPITNRAPSVGEQAAYIATDSVGYCVIAYLPNPSHKRKVLLIEGSSSEATEAGGDFLLSEEQFSKFRKMLHVEKFPYFEVLLKTSNVKSTPITATIEAYRAYPDLQ